MAERPVKIPLSKFLSAPFVDISYALLPKLGWWDCDGCHKLHGPRTQGYYIPGIWMGRRQVCSLHVVDKEADHDTTE